MKIMITGSTGGFGEPLVRRLEREPDVDTIIGIGNEEVESEMEASDEDEERLKFVSADLRKKRVEEVFIKNPDIDVLVHLAFDNAPEHASRMREETNIFGTKRMIELSRKYGVKKFIFKSPTAIYGANPDNPALIKEDYPLRGNRRYQSVQNKIEADLTCQMSIHPEIMPNVVILRFCGILGDNVRSPLNTLFGKKLVPMVLGYDPMFQIIHEEDVTEALALAALKPCRGVYNVAGKHTEPLSEVIDRLGKVSVPLPEGLIRSAYGAWFLKNREHAFPFDINYIKYSFAADSSRFEKELGFRPER